MNLCRFITEHRAKPQIYRWISVGSNDKLQKRTNFLSAVRLICFASIEGINVALYYDKFDKFQF